MAITYKGGNRITGLSTDARPDVINLVDGTIFTETNTGKEYIKYYGDWSERNQPNDSVGLALNYADETNQHFWDFFSGKQLDSRWTLQNNTALPTVAMQDSVNGGLFMTNTGAGSGGSLVFNGIKQYGKPCSCIMVIKNTTTNGYTYAGFDRTGIPSTGTNNSTAVIEMGASTYMNLVVTDNGSGWDRTASSIATANTDWWCVKIDVKASSVDLTMNGTLEATRASVSPSTSMQPCIMGRNAGANATTYIRYMEAYNT